MNRSPLTGDKNTDTLVLMKLTDSELGQVCQVNKYVKSLCEDDIFWMNRFIMKYSILPTDGQQFRKYLGLTWKELYQYFSEFKFKKIQIVINFLRNPAYIDNVIKDIVKPDLPRWINRELLQIDFRKHIIKLLNGRYSIDSNLLSSVRDDFDPFVKNFITSMNNHWLLSKPYRKLPKKLKV